MHNSRLEINIGPVRTTIVFGGNMQKLAREVARVGVENPDFAFALNLAVCGMNEELEAIRLRDEMIGMIVNH